MSTNAICYTKLALIFENSIIFMEKVKFSNGFGDFLKSE